MRTYHVMLIVKGTPDSDGYLDRRVVVADAGADRKQIIELSGLRAAENEEIIIEEVI